MLLFGKHLPGDSCAFILLSWPLVLCCSPSFALLGADLHTIGCAASFNQYREVFVFLCTASHEVDIICEYQVADWSATEGDWQVVVVNASYITFSMKTLNRVGESRYPCWTPNVVLYNSSMWLFGRTAQVASSYITLMILFSGSSMLLLLWPSTNYHAISGPNVFLTTMKLWDSSLWWSRCFSTRNLKLKICSVVLLPPLKPVCSSVSTSSTFGLSLLRWFVCFPYLLA